LELFQFGYWKELDIGYSNVDDIPFEERISDGIVIEMYLSARNDLNPYIFSDDKKRVLILPTLNYLVFHRRKDHQDRSIFSLADIPGQQLYDPLA